MKFHWLMIVHHSHKKEYKNVRRQKNKVVESRYHGC
jgi:hypothetical protein